MSMHVYLDQRHGYTARSTVYVPFGCCAIALSYYNRNAPGKSLCKPKEFGDRLNYSMCICVCVCECACMRVCMHDCRRVCRQMAGHVGACEKIGLV